jgi:hypothetical protein
MKKPEKKAGRKELSPEKKREQILDKMNEGAEEAAEAFVKLDKKVKSVMTEFFKTWVPKAGYKRLGKIIVGKPLTKEE